MKKQAIVILILLFVIVIIIAFAIAQNVSAEKDLFRYNEQYNKYLNGQVLGTEVASLINKAINANEKNNIEKDEKEYYISNVTIQDIELDLEEVEMLKQHKLLENFRPLEVYESIENRNEEIQLLNLYGNNGKISEKELINWQKILTN